MSTEQPPQGNILTQVPWVRVVMDDDSSRALTVRDALAQAGQIKTLAPSLNGVEHFTTMRILTHVYAVVMRQFGPDEDLVMIDDLPEALVDRGLQEMVPLADLFDHQDPALQVHWDSLPLPVPKTGEGKGWEEALPYNIKPSTSQFWNFGPETADERRDLARITLSLAVVAMYSASNNGGLKSHASIPNRTSETEYPWTKPFSSTPGFRFSPNPILEVHVEGPNLARTLASSTPRTWVTDDTSLPGWLDTRALNGEGHLWKASWTSNLTATLWDHGGETPVLSELQRVNSLIRAPRVTMVARGAGPTDRQIAEIYNENMRLVGVKGGKKAETIEGMRASREVNDHLMLHRPSAEEGATCRVFLPATGQIIGHVAQWYADAAGGILRAQIQQMVDPTMEDSRLVFHRYLDHTSTTTPAIEYSSIAKAELDQWILDDAWVQQAGARATKALNTLSYQTDPSQKKSDKRAGHPLIQVHQSICSQAAQEVAEWGLLLTDAARDGVTTLPPTVMSELAQRLEGVIHDGFSTIRGTAVPEAAASASALISMVRRALLSDDTKGTTKKNKETS